MRSSPVWTHLTRSWFGYAPRPHTHSQGKRWSLALWAISFFKSSSIFTIIGIFQAVPIIPIIERICPILPEVSKQFPQSSSLLWPKIWCHQQANDRSRRVVVVSGPLAPAASAASSAPPSCPQAWEWTVHTCVGGDSFFLFIKQNSREC